MRILIPMAVLLVGCGGPTEDLRALVAADTGYAESLWVGPRPDGAVCAGDQQCRTGKCTATAASCGTCVAWARLGEACQTDDACSRTAKCGPDKHCVSTRQAEGTSCRLEPKGGDLGDCDLELACGPDENNLPRCQRGRPLGARCGLGAPCRRGARCGDEKVCVPFAEPKAGESCATIRYCAKGFWCTDAKTCAARSVLAPGDACGLNVSGADCPAGTACGNLQYPNGGAPQGTTTTCLALPTEGHAAISYQCAAGLWAPYRDGTSPICEPKRGVGGDCSAFEPGGSPCADGLECRFGKCATVCQ